MGRPRLTIEWSKGKANTTDAFYVRAMVFMIEQGFKNEYDNLMTCKAIGEGLFISGRSVSGTMRKLIADEYVTKNASSPIQYSLTEKGENYVDKD
jgi:Mn-dependent DtxR family transcriptional regulator